MKSNGNFNGFYRYCLLLILAIVVSGCVTLPDPEVSQDWNSDIVGVVDSTHSIGQTIQIRRDNFNGITVWVSANMDALEASPQNEQLLNIELFVYPEPLKNIYQTTLRLESKTEISPIYISFPPQHKSSAKIYFIHLRMNSGSINVHGRNENSYLDGQAFIDMQSIDGDIAFNTTYDFDTQALIEDTRHWFEATWLIIPLLLIILLPGVLLLIALKDFQYDDFNTLIGLGIGLSLAINPLLILWTSTIGIAWNESTAYFISGFLTSALIILWIRKNLKKPDFTLQNILERMAGWKSKVFLKTIFLKRAGSLFLLFALLSVFITSLIVRLIMVRDLATPAWVDSVHHALLTRIILETGALPETYLPYLNIEPTFYHPGFHSQLAMFQLLSDLDIPIAMLIFGQVINAFVIYAVYSLAVSMTNNKIIGLFSAIISGLFTPMPAYYTSWGRYTQLTGLLILVAAYIFFKRAVYRTDNKILSSQLVTVSVAASGLFLVHYRATAFLILFLIADVIIRFVNIDRNWKFGRIQAFRMLIIVTICILLTLPWLIQALPNTFIKILTESVPQNVAWFADFSWNYLNAGLGKQALALGVLGMLWGILQKKRFALILLIWVGLLIILANMSALGLPGGIYINTSSVEILLFIPISICTGYFLVEIIKFWKLVLPKVTHRWVNLTIGLIMIILSIYGAQNITPILNPVTFLSRNPDILAIHWVKENIPQGERILINPFLWGYGLYAGNDGGYWITPLTGRLTVPPPALYARSPKDDYTFVNETSQFAIDHGNDAEGLHSYMTKNNLSYIFIGARGGPISPKVLASFSGFREVYNLHGVQIFKLLP